MWQKGALVLPNRYGSVKSPPRWSCRRQLSTCYSGPLPPTAQVFQDTRHLVQSAVDGYNVCIFAYG